MSGKDRKELNPEQFEAKRDGMGPEERKVYSLEDIADSLYNIRRLMAAKNLPQR